ncbi:MAG: hypothetical protein IPJ06_11680 [Saprospiraceae bacterium]|nr:hypothetical protein [Saprospiraceae bacterium]
MGLLIKIAWRNIWRSRTRSLVVLGAISLGIWALIFLLSFSRGMVYNLIDNSIRREIGHLQLEHPDFHKQREFRFYIEDADSLGALFFRDLAWSPYPNGWCRSGWCLLPRARAGCESGGWIPSGNPG